jgi:hypothetical protein
VNYRQSEDKTFEKFLNTIRCGEIDSPLALDVINQLNTSHLCHRIEQKYTYISATNNDCDRINQRFIQEIASPEIVFSAKYFDSYNKNSSNKGFEFIHKQLLMKIGMKILFNKNVYEKSTPLFLNGESGEIVDINIAGNFCKVRKENGKIINVGYQQ